MNGDGTNGAGRCRWCGAEVERAKTGRVPPVCPACARVRRAAYVRLYHKYGGGVAPAMLAEEIEAALDAVRAERRFRPAGRRARCLFCGREQDVDARGYCRACVIARYDSVHEATGRTNGWDRPPRRGAGDGAVAGGWRGRPINFYFQGKRPCL